MVKMNFIRSSEKVSTGFFSSRSEKNKIQSFKKSIMEPEIKMEVGKAIEIDYRTIYPIVKIVTIKNNAFLSAEIFPVALVIEEAEKKYVIHLMDDEIESEELIEMVSSRK